MADPDRDLVATGEALLVTPYRRERLQSIGWLLALGAIGLFEARSSDFGLGIFVIGLCYALWLSRRRDQRTPRLDWDTLPDVPASSHVEGPITSGVRTLAYTVILIAGILIGIALPAVGGFSAGVALGSASWAGITMRRVTGRESRGDWRLYTSTERRRWHVVGADPQPPTYYRSLFSSDRRW